MSANRCAWCDKPISGEGVSAEFEDGTELFCDDAHRDEYIAYFGGEAQEE